MKSKVCGQCYAREPEDEIINPIIMKALAEATKEPEATEPEWIPGDCDTCGFNDGKCYGHCIWDEHLEFDPYEACMIMAKRGKEQEK